MSQAFETKLSDLPLSQIDLSRPELYASEDVLETFGKTQ